MSVIILPGPQRPLNLECSHTLCQQCIERGALRTCSTCRHPITKPVAQLSPNYALIEAIELRNQSQTDIGDVVVLLERIGIRGARGLVLDPNQITLVREISNAGATGVVWEGKLFGSQRVRMAYAHPHACILSPL